MKEVSKGGNIYQWVRLLLKYRTQRIKKGANKIQLDHLKQFLADDCVFFDIGANKGLFTYWAGKYIKKNADLHIFEPQPELKWIYLKFQKIFLTHQLFYNNFGLSDIEGKALINRECIGDGSASLNTFDTEVDNAESVRLQTLDYYCEKNAIDKIDFIKIDVEGHEYKTLAGGMKTIEKLMPTMLVEMSPGTLSTKALEEFSKLGYKVKMIWSGRTFDSSSHFYKHFISEKKTPNSHADFLFYH